MAKYLRLFLSHTTTGLRLMRSVAGRLPELMEYIRGTQARAEAEERTRLAQEQLKTDAKVLAQAQKQTVEAATRVTAVGDAMSLHVSAKLAKMLRLRKLKPRPLRLGVSKQCWTVCLTLTTLMP